MHELFRTQFDTDSSGHRESVEIFDTRRDQIENFRDSMFNQMRGQPLCEVLCQRKQLMKHERRKERKDLRFTGWTKWKWGF